MPLQQLAERNSAAVLMISHFNKGTIDGTAMSRISGSGALVAVCRSSWLVERDPSALDGPKRIFAPIKNNIGDDQTGFAFEIDQIETEGGIKSSSSISAGHGNNLRR